MESENCNICILRSNYQSASNDLKFGVQYQGTRKIKINSESQAANPKYMRSVFLFIHKLIGSQLDSYKVNHIRNSYCTHYHVFMAPVPDKVLALNLNVDSQA